MPPRGVGKARGKTAPPIKTPAGASSSASAASASSTTAATTKQQQQQPEKDTQALPPKDAALLSQVFQQYEEKKYAASIKTADLILKKYPQNAQTTCMKGLSTYNAGKREEGKELARKGLSFDLKSHVCWNVMALIHRADREYTEALKCYVQGNKIEPNDLNILRDKINLELFSRNYEDAVNSRLHLLRLQPRIRYNWTSLAIAHHLNKDYAKASELLQAYVDMLEDVPANDFEHSEVVMYRIYVYIEAGEFDKAQEVLEKDGRRIMDQQTKKEFIAQVQSGLGKAKAAELTYGELLERNSDNKDYVEAYLSSRGIELSKLTDDNRSEALTALQELSDRLPRSRTIRRIVLDAASEETYRKRLSAYLVDGLTKGIPSLFSDIKRLLADYSKREITKQVAIHFKELLESGKTIEGDDAESGIEEAPTTYVWLLYFLAQVYSHTGSHSEALSTISLAISHTPVLPELHMIKARILKRSGDLLGAEEAMRQARFLDGQDRYLNTKHAKYLLSIDEAETAEEIAGMFTRKDAESPLLDLTDMQCLWFLLAEGDSYRRQGKLGLALKRYTSIEKIFSEIFEDEFDFHGYCMRKFTLRACVNMVRSNNVLRKHPGFLRAARGAIEIYLQLEQQPYTKPSTNGISDATEDGDEAERRKAEKKAKKAEAKAKAAAEEAKKLAAKATGGKKPDEKEAEEEALKKEVDQDPNGDKLWETRTPLKDLGAFADHLERLGQDSTEAQELVFEVAFRKREYLRALKALMQFHSIAPQSPILHVQLVRFAQLVREVQSAIPEAPRAIIVTELEPLISSSLSLEGFNNDFLQRHPENAEAILAAARAQFYLSKSQDTERVADALLQVTRQKGDQPSLQVVTQALRFLREEVKAEPSKVDAFVSTAKEIYPLSTLLKSSEEVAEQKKEIEAFRKNEREAGNEDAASADEQKEA